MTDEEVGMKLEDFDKEEIIALVDDIVQHFSAMEVSPLSGIVAALVVASFGVSRLGSLPPEGAVDVFRKMLNAGEDFFDFERLKENLKAN